jgi:hypothetical protein
VRNFVHLQIFQQVNARLSRNRDIEVAIPIQVFRDELCSGSGGSVDGDGHTGEVAGMVDLVVIDNQRIVGARIVAVMSAIALARQQLHLAIAVDID